jgi:hypothetical protein
MKVFNYIFFIFLHKYLNKTPYSNKYTIKKILKVDYHRGKTKGYFANFTSAKRLKIEFSIFYFSVIRHMPDDISPAFQGRTY